jgi:ADP-ribosylglycohydrolase
MSNIHQQSIQRALTSLEGLSVGDAFGNKFYGSEHYIIQTIKDRTVPLPSWPFTDDTNMALSIVASLNQFEKIDQDWLAQSFAERFELIRAYGVGMHTLLEHIGRGKHWSKEAKNLFYGTGSYGNGAAMRVAPLGAYFADDLYLTVQQSGLSAEVTHAHPEGIAGGIAVAVATALAWQFAQRNQKPAQTEFLAEILKHIPESDVKAGIKTAQDLPPETSVAQAVRILGNGSAISAQDTVPFSLWCAARHLDNYAEALWFTLSGLGDRDTTCAIVGGIVAAYVGIEGIPQDWRNHREPLPTWAFQNT